MDEILHDIKLERIKQDEKWGAVGAFKGDNYRALAVLAEEFGEVARDCLEHNNEHLKEELVQVAAVCVKWLQMIEDANE